MKSLDTFVEGLPEEAPLQTLAIDVSEFAGEAPGTTFFRYEEPDIARTFQIPVDALALRRFEPDWPENLRMTIAMLAGAHREPPVSDQPAALLYIQIARKRKDLFGHLSAEFNKAFPHLMGSREAIEDEKKSGESGETNLLSA